MNKSRDSNSYSEKQDTGTLSLGGKYLTFKLANEEYGLQILKVREIIGLIEITKVPKAPDYIRGMINLRGRVIPVLELRSKFAMEKVTDTEKTCIIVVDVAQNESKMLMGVLVDSVSEVLAIQDSEIQETPSFGGNVDVNFILGIGKVKSGVKILLDIDRIVNADGDISLAEFAAASVSESKTAMAEEVLLSR